MTKSFAIIALIGASLVALWGGITLASQQGGAQAGVGGAYPSDFNLQDDTCLHDQPIWGGPPPHNRSLDVSVNGPDLQMSGPSPVVPVFDETFDGTNINAQGTGTVAGFPNTAVTFVGTYSNGQITGTYTFGNANPPGQGGLPPCDDDNNPGTPDRPHSAVYGIKPKPGTPTPTGTPPKLYSIIVIKLNDDSLQPVPGWEIRLYAGPNCGGTALDTKQTDADGMVDFEGLDPGSYSVSEINQAGWNPVGATCKSAELPGDIVAGIPACPIVPDAPFPQPGCDTFPSAARVQVRFNGTGTVISADIGGPVQIRRNNKPIDKDGDGLDEVNTEMIYMDLTGPGITVRESALQHSNGLIEEQVNVTSGVMDFPANSFFDVFFEVDVGGMTLHNNDPLRMACKIDQVPPYKCFYEPPIKTPIDLLDANDVKVAKLVHGLHIPIPPNGVVVIFTNRPKTTPTVTPTPAEGTVTPTGTSPATTVTPTPQPAATSTPTPRPRDGDANKDGTTNAIDAALVLQYSAGLITSINPRSDANDDGMTNPIDATLILQFVAGYLPVLPFG